MIRGFMNKEEYEKQRERVSEYQRVSREIENLHQLRAHVEDGDNLEACQFLADSLDKMPQVRDSVIQAALSRIKDLEKEVNSL